MKFQVKLKELVQTPDVVEKALSTKLKKPLGHLAKNPGDKLPFCYGFGLFGDGRHFISIGIAKEIDKHWKQKRVKGQGLDENMKPIKVDKKKYACGTIHINEDGVYVFSVLHGIMKPMEAKAAIKSIPILKKTIGDNYMIVKGEVVEEAPTTEEEDVTTDDETVDRSGMGDETTTDGTEEQQDTTGETTDDTTGDTSSETAPDGKAIAAEFSKIDAAYKSISSLEGQEKAKKVLVVYKNLQSYKPKLEAYVGQVDGKNKAKGEQMLKVITAYYDKLESVASKLDQQVSKKYVDEMEGLFGTLSDEIRAMLNDEGLPEEIKNLMSQIVG